MDWGITGGEVTREEWQALLTPEVADLLKRHFIESMFESTRFSGESRAVKLRELNCSVRVRRVLEGRGGWA